MKLAYRATVTFLAALITSAALFWGACTPKTASEIRAIEEEMEWKR
jgi:hypothetical protein